jgi:hypothetical protein
MQARSNIKHLHPEGYPHDVRDEARVRHHLAGLLASPHFDAGSRSRCFLRYVVDEVLAGRGPSLNQAAIAISVFGRDASFDPMLDPIVRVQAGRLRRSLERYYLLCGDSQLLRIELPKGSYAPIFVGLAAPSPASAEAPAHPLALSCTLEDQLAMLLGEELIHSSRLRELIAACLRKAEVRQQ